MISDRVASQLLKIGGMTFRFNPPYVYTTGLKSPIYLDVRQVISYPKVRKQITKFYVDIIKRKIGLKNVDYISATATAAIPQGAWVASAMNLPMVYVRPTTKSYGKGGKVEGHFTKGSKVVIIEDHITTAASVENNTESIREIGGKVKFCITTTTYETEKAKNILKKSKVTLFTLTTGRKIVEVAEKEKYISKKEKEIVDVWFKDPQGWAKKMGFEK